MSAVIGVLALVVLVGFGVAAGRRDAKTRREVHRRAVKQLNERLCNGRGWTAADLAQLRRDNWTGR